MLLNNIIHDRGAIAVAGGVIYGPPRHASQIHIFNRLNINDRIYNIPHSTEYIYIKDLSFNKYFLLFYLIFNIYLINKAATAIQPFKYKRLNIKYSSTEYIHKRFSI